MSTPIPPPLRAVAGLAAVAIDNARKLPEQLVGLPVLAVSAALQVSLKAQQRYAALVARGDEVLGQLRPEEDAPPWARFDDEPSGPPARPRSAFDAVGEPESDLVGGVDAGLDAGLVAGEAGFDAVGDAGFAVTEESDLDAAGPGFAGGAGEGALLDEVAAEQLGGGEPEATLLADAEVAGWGGADIGGEPVLEPDGVTATEAEAGGLDVAEIPLDDAPGIDLPTGSVTGTPPPTGRKAGRKTGPGQKTGPGRKAGTDRKKGRKAGAVSEPGVDLPAGLTTDAEAVGDALAGNAAETEAAVAATAAGREPGSVGEPGVDLPAGLTTDAEAVGDALESGLDGYLAVEPPIPHYDDLSIPQLRGRLRSLSADQLADLIAYERSNAARPPYLTMLENRLTTVRAR